MEDQTLEVGLFDCFLSSSVVEDGGGRSPYNPPNIVCLRLFGFVVGRFV